MSPTSALFLGGDLATDAGEVLRLVPAAVAVIVLATAARTGYRKTLGRRRDRYARLSRLGTGAQLTFFTFVLGEPPAIRRTLTRKVREYVSQAEYEAAQGRKIAKPARRLMRRSELDDEMVEIDRLKSYIECFFVDRDYYVQALCDEDETVLGFSVTSRTRRFRPTFVSHPNLGRRERREYKKMTGERWAPSLAFGSARRASRME